MLVAFEYIKYLLQSKKRHGVHSPFIYDLTDKCFAASVNDSDIEIINEFNKINKNNHSEIEITDHGAGSKHMSNKRKVSQIFKNSSSNGKFGDLLYKLTSYYKPKNILELGTSLGTGTIRMSLGNPESEITTIEGCPETAKVAESNFMKLGIKNVQLINSTFEKYLSDLKCEPYDLIFIDGHHDGNALIHYLGKLEPYIHNDTIILLDDIRWSNDMYDAWKEIISREKYHVSIDFFRMGMILIREQQMKEHFSIRM